MPKEEWGVKRICPTTGRRFYDLNKDPIVSPYTGEVVTVDANSRTRAAIPEKPVEKEDTPVEVVADADDILEDADLLVEDAVEDPDLADDILEDDDDADIPLEEIADVAAPDDES